MSRVESKFLLSLSQYEFIKDRCRLLFDRDKNSKDFSAYPILSAYFDTPDLQFYYQKINGEYNHRKIRLRCYGTSFSSSHNSFLEIKSKENNEQVKLRIPIDFDMKYFNPNHWIDIDREEIDKILLLEANLYHVLNIYYEREAYEWRAHPSGSIRINFDVNFCVLPSEVHMITQNSLDQYRLMPESMVICEIKTPSLEMPYLLQNELKAIGAEQLRISKYAEAVTAMHLRSHRQAGYNDL